jgi:hypothetical protein
MPNRFRLLNCPVGGLVAMISLTNILLLATSLLLMTVGYRRASHPGDWYRTNEAFLQFVGFPQGVGYRPRTIRNWGRFSVAIGAALMAYLVVRVFS